MNYKTIHVNYTTVAETSITVPGVKIVIDTGLAKASRFDR